MKTFIFLIVPYDRERPYSMKNDPWSPASVQPRSAVGHRTVSRTRRLRRLKGVSNSAGGPVCRLPAEMSSVQALINLALPGFAVY